MKAEASDLEEKELEGEGNKGPPGRTKGGLEALH